MLPIEGSIFSNLVGIFGGNIILLILFATAIVAFILFMFRMPVIIAAPFFLVFLLIFAGGGGETSVETVPGLKIIIGIIAGIAMGYLIWRLWGGK